MTQEKLIRSVFLISAIYDFVLGFSFLFFGRALFRGFHVDAPNHWGYIEFPALLLMIFGLMFWEIAKDPKKNRNLMPYGILLKLSYSGVVFYHWLFHASIPRIWKPFAFIDLVFAALFIWAYVKIAKIWS